MASKPPIQRISSRGGFPSPAEEELADSMTLDEFLIPNHERTILLTMSGDSMIDAGIRDGDLLLVERTTNPKPGHIVVVELEGETTLRHLRKRGQTLYLEAANTNIPPLYPTESLAVQGVLTTVIRKLR
jgi:SOS-response transcriptional repressor LexA